VIKSRPRILCRLPPSWEQRFGVCLFWTAHYSCLSRHSEQHVTADSAVAQISQTSLQPPLFARDNHRHFWAIGRSHIAIIAPCL